MGTTEEATLEEVTNSCEQKKYIFDDSPQLALELHPNTRNQICLEEPTYA